MAKSNPLAYTGAEDASTTVKGVTEFATVAETVAGTETNKACTPAGVAAVVGTASSSLSGQATLASGTVTVANTDLEASDLIFLTRADANSSSALGDLTITAQTASTSFVITALDPSDGSSTITGDTSIVNYNIVRPI